MRAREGRCEVGVGGGASEKRSEGRARRSIFSKIKWRWAEGAKARPGRGVQRVTSASSFPHQPRSHRREERDHHPS